MSLWPDAPGRGGSWGAPVLDALPPTGVLNMGSGGALSLEETALLNHRPGGGNIIHLYYVPATSTRVRGHAYRTAVTGMQPGVALANTAAVDSAAHERTHVLLNDGTHHPDPDNLMANGSIRRVGVDLLDASRCARM